MKPVTIEQLLDAQRVHDLNGAGNSTTHDETVRQALKLAFLALGPDTHVLAKGSIDSGFEIFGLFESHGAAEEYAEGFRTVSGDQVVAMPLLQREES